MRFVVAAVWVGMTLAGGAAAQSALPDSRPLDAGRLAVERVCTYPVVGGGVLLGRTSPIRCEPPAEAAPSRLENPLVEPVPASNPLGPAPFATSPRPGFERAFEDGRINLSRGVPFPVSGPAVPGARVAAPGPASVLVVAP